MPASISLKSVTARHHFRLGSTPHATPDEPWPSWPCHGTGGTPVARRRGMVAPGSITTTGVENTTERGGLVTRYFAPSLCPRHSPASFIGSLGLKDEMKYDEITPLHLPDLWARRSPRPCWGPAGGPPRVWRAPQRQTCGGGVNPPLLNPPPKSRRARFHHAVRSTLPRIVYRQKRPIS